LDPKENYQAEMMRALEKCQFIEETLKMCILSAVRIAEEKLSPYFPINYKVEEISKLPLGPLVKKFSKINDDKELHKDLRDITKERNFVAHQSLLFTLGELEDEAFMGSAIQKLKDIADRATKIHERVLDIRYNLVRAEKKTSRGELTKNA